MYIVNSSNKIVEKETFVFIFSENGVEELLNSIYSVDLIPSYECRFQAYQILQGTLVTNQPDNFQALQF